MVNYSQIREGGGGPKMPEIQKGSELSNEGGFFLSMAGIIALFSLTDYIFFSPFENFETPAARGGYPFLSM